MRLTVGRVATGVEPPEGVVLGHCRALAASASVTAVITSPVGATSGA